MTQANRQAVLGAGPSGRIRIDRISRKPELALTGMADLASAGAGQAIACTLAP